MFEKQTIPQKYQEKAFVIEDEPILGEDGKQVIEEIVTLKIKDIVIKGFVPEVNYQKTLFNKNEETTVILVLLYRSLEKIKSGNREIIPLNSEIHYKICGEVISKIKDPLSDDSEGVILTVDSKVHLSMSVPNSRYGFKVGDYIKAIGRLDVYKV